MRLTLLFISLSFSLSYAQPDLPKEVNITEQGTLKYGGNETTGFYNIENVHKLEITLTDPDWFQKMDGSGGGGPGGGNEGESLIATLTFNDTLVLDSVLVGIKGQTSDFQNNSEKKSFKIEIDELKEQDLMGYDNLNLNCAFQDQSGMREVLYYDISKSFTSALKGSFVDLYINGQYWGPYNNIQQIEGQYIKEWFTNNDGTRWRAVRPDGVSGGGPGGGGPGGGGMFGTGVSSLNYNGPDSTDYNENYTLKRTEKENPWEDLINVCDILNNTDVENLYEQLNPYFDIDRTLWFLAQEMIFSDDDSYIHKGGMDYYVYWDEATNRLFPLEVDGNSVMVDSHYDWSPFYNENDSRFPLLNRMLQNTEIRQRYLAHIRTILTEFFIEDKIHSRIDQFAEILDQRVQDDPKKIYSYNQFVNGIESLKGFITDRIQFLLSNDEIDKQGVGIDEVDLTSSLGDGLPPNSNEEALISVKINGDAQKVMLYHGVGFDGTFERIQMYDDGMHNDQTAGDGIYGASIPGYSAGSYVRYYIEAIKNNASATASYHPSGAEHETFIYQVGQTVINSETVVINEFMADNETSITDSAGEYDDWIEIYNRSDEEIDLSGYFLSDNESQPLKWQFPEGTTLEANSYMIIWADEDQEQTSNIELHTNFKLSAGGEVIILSNSDEEALQYIEFGEQAEDLSFARKPNGTGDFEISEMTFGFNNDENTSSLAEENIENNIHVWPNPASDYIYLSIGNKPLNERVIKIFNSKGQIVHSLRMDENQSVIDISKLAVGIYFIGYNPNKEMNKLIILK